MPTDLANREIQTQTTLHPLAWLQSKQWTITHMKEDMETLEPSSVMERNIKCILCTALWEPIWQFFRKLNIELS